MRRRSKPTPRPAVSPSHSAACGSIRRAARCSTSSARRSPASMPLAKWSAACSISTIRAAPGWCPAPSSVASPARAPANSPSRPRGEGWSEEEMIMQLAHELARRSAALRFADLPAQAGHWAKVGILDTVGVTLAGSAEPAAQIVARLCPSSTGASRVFGTAGGASALDAALINGTAAHALDFDDCNNTLGGHPSAPILPALFALGGGVSGKAFIAAYAVGVECETKLARAVHFHHYEKGWHPTSTLGTFGSAAACGHLMRLTPEQLANALALAASMASGIKANFGTMTKPFHIGHAARNGLLAALLAREGMTANPAALEHPQGFFAVYNGAGTFDASRILAE